MQEAQELTFMTLAEFDALEKDERFNYELIDGVVMMSPSPTMEHQLIGGNIYVILRAQLRNNLCRAVYELDLLVADCKYRPDISIFCDTESPLPEIVFEILSPSTKHKDLTTKVQKYKEIGIKEYWIIDPKTKSVIIHYFFNETSDTFGLGDTAASLIHPEIQIEVAQIFA